MNFGEALEALKSGASIAREGWNGKDMFLYLEIFEHHQPCITMFTANKKLQPGWLASQADMLSEDWVVIAEQED